MKKIKGTLLALLGVAVIAGCQNNDILNNPQDNLQPVSAQANKTAVKKHLVKIALKDKTQLLDLASEGLDLFGSGEGGKYGGYLTNAQLDLLKSKNVQILSVNSSFDDNQRMPSGYHTVQQVIATMRDYAAKYPDLVTLNDIGDSWEKTAGKSGNDIWALTISNKKAQKKAKPVITFISGQHARELAPVELNLRLMELLLTSYGKDPQITQYIDTRDIVFIPVSNIDGRVAVEQGNSMWRKNRHIDKDNDGIDLNRNFEGHWNFQGVPSTPTIERFKRQMADPDSEIYSGKAPFSEPETQAIRNFLANKEVTIIMDLHSFGKMVIWPPGYTTAAIPETPIFRKVGKALTDRNGYRGGTSMELLYPTCGTTKDWGNEYHHALAFTMEVGSDSDGFDPPYSRVDKIWAENKDGLVYLVSIADNPKKVME